MTERHLRKTKTSKDTHKKPVFIKCAYFVSVFLLIFTICNTIVNAFSYYSFYNNNVSPSNRKDYIIIASRDLKAEAIAQMLYDTECRKAWKELGPNCLEDVELSKLFGNTYSYRSRDIYGIDDIITICIENGKTYRDYENMLNDLKTEQELKKQEVAKDVSFGQALKHLMLEMNKTSNFFKITILFVILFLSLFCTTIHCSEFYSNREINSTIAKSIAIFILVPIFQVSIKYYDLVEEFSKLKINFIPCLMVCGILVGIIYILATSIKEGKK